MGKMIYIGGKKIKGTVKKYFDGKISNMEGHTGESKIQPQINLLGLYRGVLNHMVQNK